MRLRDTRTGERCEVGAPERPIGLYVCGITPYDRPHLGHARAAVVFDALVRFLRSEQQDVIYVRNITDIDDKIIERAGGGDCDVERSDAQRSDAQRSDAQRSDAQRCDAQRCDAFTRPHIASYHAMAAALGCLSPDVEPRVSTHIPEIVALVERLIDRGHAYASAGSVYFAVRTFPDYGALSGRAIDDLVAGARVEPPAEPVHGVEKRDPLDFALWKAAKPGEPFWPSPWGSGRPGWHIECSAMAMKHLGETVDIHGGGNDLLFPHHENERAQSEAATGRPFVRIWMHNGMITLERRKMAKSEGNTLDPMELLDRWGARVLRFALLNAHYASPIDFSEERLRGAKSALERFETLAAGAEDGDAAPAAEVIEGFRAALAEDFNTAAALSVLFEAVREANRRAWNRGTAACGAVASRRHVLAAIRACGAMIGLDLLPERARDEEIEGLIAERNAARATRDFALADRIRKRLSERGVIIEDTAKGTIWRR